MASSNNRPYLTSTCNLVPRVFSSLKMAVGETPGQGCQSGSKSSLEFRHTNTIKCLHFVWITVSDCRKQRGPPDAGNNLRKNHFIMCHVTKYSTIRGVFQQPWPGFLRPPFWTRRRPWGRGWSTWPYLILVGTRLVHVTLSHFSNHGPRALSLGHVLWSEWFSNFALRTGRKV